MCVKSDACPQAGALIQAGEPPSLKSGHSPPAPSELGPGAGESQHASLLREASQIAPVLWVSGCESHGVSKLSVLGACLSKRTS